MHLSISFHNLFSVGIAELVPHVNGDQEPKYIQTNYTKILNKAKAANGLGSEAAMN